MSREGGREGEMKGGRERETGRERDEGREGEGGRGREREGGRVVFINLLEMSLLVR